MNEQLQTKSKLNGDSPISGSLINLETGRLRGIETTRINQFRDNRIIFDDQSQPLPEDVIVATLTLADLRVGKNFLDITHTVDANDRQKPYYATNITNRSTEKIRIDKFGTYTLNDDILVLHTMTGGFFSDQQFQELYDLSDGWIEPGKTVTDPNNHSKVGVYWTYFCTTEGGQEFIAGSVWGGKHWWKVW